MTTKGVNNASRSRKADPSAKPDGDGWGFVVDLRKARGAQRAMARIDITLPQKTSRPSENIKQTSAPHKTAPDTSFAPGHDTIPYDLKLEVTKIPEKERTKQKLEVKQEKTGKTKKGRGFEFSFTPKRKVTYKSGDLKHPIRAFWTWLKSMKISAKGEFRIFGYKIKMSFAMIALLAALFIPTLGEISVALNVKDELFATGSAALSNIQSAESSLKSVDFTAAQSDFNAAYQNFVRASDQIDSLGAITLGLLEVLPGISDQVSSGRSMVELGERLSTVGRLFAQSAVLFSDSRIFNDEATSEAMPDGSILTPTNTDTDFTKVLSAFQDNLLRIRDELAMAQKLYLQIDPRILPTENQQQFRQLGDILPFMHDAVSEGNYYLAFIRSFLGEEGQKKYLLAFQNNSELRATGGFIGTYGILNVDRGNIRELKVEGVYNVDGQLTVDVKPPRPLQKVAAGWSLHDSNWFFDFPTSARKMMWFYEQTGPLSGTVDGVIAMTPAIIEQLLEITGPIDLPKYDVVLTADNFIDVTQQEVEVDYDEALNRPKQILTDLTARLLARMKKFDGEQWRAVFEALADSLRQKQIIVYLDDPKLEAFVLHQGWGGGVLKADNDYVAVVNSNINGYKTDRVIEQTVKHNAQISESGEVTVTLTVRREHNGGDSIYPWYNQVNANYMRVYVPIGSELLDARGHTIQSYQQRSEYEKFEFVEDVNVSHIEDTLIRDPFTGTDIFEEAGKTVFGNWVYVSPGEEVTVTYEYKLPFRVDPNAGLRNYSLLVQKQPGAKPGVFEGIIRYPSRLGVAYTYPDTLKSLTDSYVFDDTLNRDLLYGVTFTR